jgi:hypothetical protein
VMRKRSLVIALRPTRSDERSHRSGERRAPTDSMGRSAPARAPGCCRAHTGRAATRHGAGLHHTPLDRRSSPRLRNDRSTEHCLDDSLGEAVRRMSSVHSNRGRPHKDTSYTPKGLGCNKISTTTGPIRAERWVDDRSGLRTAFNSRILI